jgi:hypothetical protein
MRTYSLTRIVDVINSLNTIAHKDTFAEDKQVIDTLGENTLAEGNG